MEKSPDAFRTISEVAELLETPAHVLRFWESRFPQIKPVKRAGGRRYYRPSDVALIAGIRRLLHSEGLTIRGVQKLLREEGVRHVAALSNMDFHDPPDADEDIAPPGAEAEVIATAAVVSLAEWRQPFDAAPDPVPAALPDPVEPPPGWPPRATDVADAGQASLFDLVDLPVDLDAELIESPLELAAPDLPPALPEDVPQALAPILAPIPDAAPPLADLPAEAAPWPEGAPALPAETEPQPASWDVTADTPDQPQAEPTAWPPAWTKALLPPEPEPPAPVETALPPPFALPAADDGHERADSTAAAAPGDSAAAQPTESPAESPDRDPLAETGWLPAALRPILHDGTTADLARLARAAQALQALRAHLAQAPGAPRR